MNKTILIADDDLSVIASLKYLLNDEGFDVIAVTTPQALLENLTTQRVDLLLLDMNYQQDTTSGAEGIDLVKQAMAIDDSLPIIVMTGWASIDLAVGAMQAGAKDFIQKPWKNERILSAIDTQIALATTTKKVARLTQQNRLLTNHQHPHDRQAIIANSSKMQQLLTSLEELAQSDMSILLTGDNGTGKSMLAAYIHQASARKKHPFVAVNMGAISANLFESEMFGHVKGAFTDARENRIGRFEMAEQGTLFLDEIANIPLAQQAKLLSVLEQRQFEAVGSSKSLRADVRIISATNTNLANAIANNEFRQDLYYRLNTIELRVPSLAERKEDIIPLAEYFLSNFSLKYHRPCPQLSLSAQEVLSQYHWPGNIRELSHLMERMLFTAKSTTISAEQLMLSPTTSEAPVLDDPTLTLDDIEQKVLNQRLAYFQGNATQTAKSLGLSRSGYYRRVSKYGLD